MMTSSRTLFTLLVLAGFLAGCTSLLPPNISTPLPAEFIPTAAALTLAARGVELSSPTSSQTAAATETLPPIATDPTDSPSPTYTAPLPITLATSEPETSTPVSTPTRTSNPPLPTASAQPVQAQPSPAPGEPTWTPAPPIPDARIQIFQLGDLSKVVSPLTVSSRLTCGEGKVIRVELHGEDGRLLARHLRTYDNIPWTAARLGVPFDFEINAAAELGRLVISAEDSYGRLIEANSVNLVLLSQGMTELNPPTSLQQAIIIQEPQESALIQNGRLIVSGRARPTSNQPLRVMLVAEDGKVLGQRLAGVPISIPGDYGTYVAEVPYNVKEITPALLVVFEEGEPISDITLLTSIHIILAP